MCSGVARILAVFFGGGDVHTYSEGARLLWGEGGVRGHTPHELKILKDLLKDKCQGNALRAHTRIDAPPGYTTDTSKQSFSDDVPNVFF